MVENDKAAFRDIMVSAFEVYDKSLSVDALRLWWSVLQQYDLASVQQAFGKHISDPDNGKFAPKPADITRLIGGSTVDGALRAWTKVQDALSNVGTYRSIAFDDKYIHLAIKDIGGWIALGKVTEDEKPFVQKRFEQAYRSHATHDTAEYPPHLYGLAELHNNAAGYSYDPPRLFGDTEKAQQVLLGGTKPEASRLSFVSSLEKRLGNDD